jgi:hypothetical protein
MIEKLIGQYRADIEALNDEALLRQIELRSVEADEAFMNELENMDKCHYVESDDDESDEDEADDDELDDDDRYASEIWEEWSAGGAIVPKNHPLSHEPFHAVHTLLHVLWEFNEKYNAENLLLDWIDENGWTGEFEAFLKAHYEKETHE